MSSQEAQAFQADQVTQLNNDENTPEPYQTLFESMGALDISPSTTDFAAHAVEMQQRCRKLLDELEQYQSHLKEMKKENNVEIRTFKSSLQAEMKILDKLVAADPLDPKNTHALRSSNFPSFAVAWDIAKTCQSITAFGKRFYWTPGQSTAYINGNIPANGIGHKGHSALVTIVAQDGSEWIKVSTITEKRIIWDLAKAGWVGDSDSEEETLPFEDDDDEPQGLLKQMEALVKASLATRVRYRHPTIRLILPRIKAVPKSKEAAQILQRIRDLGVVVQTSEQVPFKLLSIDEVVSSMTADRFDAFSEVLNIDCTILLAFASDLSHHRVEPEDWHNKAISRQIEIESGDQLLPNSLWPACGARKLVCTREAAIRMQEIVTIIGTESERRRTILMLDLDNDVPLTREQRMEELQGYSDYTIPKNWCLPIEVVDVDLGSLDLPPVAKKVSENLSVINRSVFLYGWANNRTTISSNRTVAKEIEATIEGNRMDEGTTGPDIWLCSTSRSLVGKEKQRRGFH